MAQWIQLVGYGLHYLGVRVRFPAKEIYFHPLYIVQTYSGDQTGSHEMVPGDLSSGVKQSASEADRFCD
jgi:hypothetical protein